MAKGILKDRLLSGEVVHGLLSPNIEPNLVETLGLLGFDLYILDAEHGTAGPVADAAGGPGPPSCPRTSSRISSRRSGSSASTSTSSTRNTGRPARSKPLRSCARAKGPVSRRTRE